MRHLERELDRLTRRLLALSALVEENVGKAVAAVIERDAELAAEVIAADTHVDEDEVEVEEECLKILALHQPVANDLRFLVAALKLNNDLERIGDLAVNLAEQAEVLTGKAEVAPPMDIGHMASIVRSMLARALDALVSQDSAAARAVCAADDEVDALHRSMYTKVEESIRRNPDHTGTYIQYLSVSRYLERIADHATNIAEDIIYVIEGEIVRHGAGLRSD
jgi:phosphate transport system protein